VCASDTATALSSNTHAVVSNGTIGYVVTHRLWAIYQTPDGKEECPQGINDGPREQFKQQFPDDGSKRTVLETELMREGRTWYPSTEPEPFVFKEVTGKIAYGMNLDGQVKPTDFTSPEGEPGIDNQLYRAIGCIDNYRSHLDYQFDYFVQAYTYNRLLIEISGVHSLMNDDNVIVKSYRGSDVLLTDGTGAAFIPGGTQHVDEQFGRFAEATWRGKIVDGVLITEPTDMILPFGQTYGASGIEKLKGVRFRLRLTPQGAEGIMAGYVDIDEFMRQLNEGYSTHFASYGRMSTASLYRALRRLADGYPDPKTGEMTAISSALELKFVQAFIVHPSQQIDAK
jgi:hypothetical protein